MMLMPRRYAADDAAVMIYARLRCYTLRRADVDTLLRLLMALRMLPLLR